MFILTKLPTLFTPQFDPTDIEVSYVGTNRFVMEFMHDSTKKVPVERTRERYYDSNNPDEYDMDEFEIEHVIGNYSFGNTVEIDSAYIYVAELSKSSATMMLGVGFELSTDR